MRSLLPLLILSITTTATQAQKFELKINASANVTTVPSVEDQIYIVDGFVIPNYLSPSNASSVSIMPIKTSRRKAGVGFTAEVEGGMKLSEKWKLSLALGITELRYDYDTYITQSFYKNNFYLGDAFAKYGNTRFTYLTSRPLNVSWLYKRFSLQGGPILNYLVGKKYSNAVIIYDASTGQAAGAFFERKGAPQKFLFGAHLNARYTILRPLEIMLGGQYFFNSLYDKDTFEPYREKSKALQIQLGLSYKF